MTHTRPLGPFAILYEARTPAAPAPIISAADRQKAMASILRKNPYTEIGLSTVGAGNRANALRRTAI